MPEIADLLLNINKAAPHKREAGEMFVVIKRPYAHLEKEMRRTFGDREKAAVVVDRRIGERRGLAEPVAEDRRRGERRAEKEQIVEVVIKP